LYAKYHGKSQKNEPGGSKNDNAVRKAENARLDIDIANIIDEIKLIPQHFLLAIDPKYKRRSSRKRGNGLDRQLRFYETI